MTNYYGFTPTSLLMKGGDFVIGVEKLSEITDEARVLHEAHYRETETRYLDEPFFPDYVRYKEVEDRGQFIFITVRRGSTLVGYLQYYISRDMHAQGMYTAREDAFYLTPEVRGQKIAPQVLKFAEHCLQQLGCKYVGMSSKAPSGGADLGPFLNAHGYRAVATYYMKELEVKPNVL